MPDVVSANEPERKNTVGVIIAAYNAEDTIERAIASALAQPDVAQVVVVDDASPDTTFMTARDFDDPTERLLVVRQNVNQGPSAARNRALSLLHTDWFTVLDSDDFMDDGRIRALLDVAEEGYDFVADDLWLVMQDDIDGPRDNMWYPDKSEHRTEVSLAMFVDGNIPNPDRKQRELGFLKPIIRTSILSKHKLSYDERMRLGEDYDLYARILALRTSAVLTSPKGYVAVRRRDSLSARHGHRELERLYKSTIALTRLPGTDSFERRLLRKSRSNTSVRYRWARMIDAVKTKNVVSFVGCFLTSPGNAFKLGTLLFSEINKRLSKS